MVSGKTGTVVLASAVIVIAGVVVIGMLLVNRPSIIQINDGTFKIIELPYTYTRNDAYILVIGSVLSGMMISYVLLTLFSAEKKETVEGPEEIRSQHIIDSQDFIQGVLKALEGDEKKIIQEVADQGGEILQNELTLNLNFSKAKVSRMLNNLEKRGLVIKKQYGLTNKIALVKGERNE